MSSCFRYLIISLCVSLAIHTDQPDIAFDAPGIQDRDSAKACECASYPKSVKLSAKHIEGKGVGYSEGYTTLQALLIPCYSESFVPLLDGRFHIFNNQKLAANAGIGFRGVLGSYVYGINTYYDYREMRHQNYNQIGVGLEFLGKLWDIRANGYIPFGRKKSTPFDLTFDFFQGNNLFIKRKQMFVMKGIDLELGFHCLESENFSLYPALGPYYFNGEGKNAWGGEIRLEGWFKEFISINLSSSYDNLFHFIAQGEIGFHLPLGKKCCFKNESPEKHTSCSDLLTLRKRAMQPVKRAEIIVADHRKRTEIAVNPATGQPYEFLFVNNTSHSQGTFESPFSTLSQALNASTNGSIIYVYAGDGSTTGLTPTGTPFQLLDNQQLLGAGMNQTIQTTLGGVRIPSMGGMPHLDGGSGLSVINLGNNTTVSGLYITCNGMGNTVYCIGSSSGIVTNCIINGNTLAPSGQSVGIFPNNLSGNIQIFNNSIYSADLGGSMGIRLKPNGTNSNILISGNNVNGFLVSSQEAAITVYATGPSIGNGSTMDVSISGNIISNTANGLDIETGNSGGTNPIVSTGAVTISGNTIENNVRHGLYMNTIGSGQGIYTVSANILHNNGDSSGHQSTKIETYDHSTLCLNFQNNISSGEAIQYAFYSYVPSTFNLMPFIDNSPNFYDSSGSSKIINDVSSCSGN